MKIFEGNVNYQGDIGIELVDLGAVKFGDEVQPIGGRLVVGHSETGSDHATSSTVARLWRGENPLVCYLSIEGDYADLVHHRDVNQHETWRLPRVAGKCYRIRRQREQTPQGWVREIQD